MQGPMRLLTISQAAAELGVHVNTLRGWVDKGWVEAVHLPSGYRRFTPEQIAKIKARMLEGKDDARRRPRRR